MRRSPTPNSRPFTCRNESGCPEASRCNGSLAVKKEASVIRHVVMFKFKPESQGEQRKDYIDRSAGCPNRSTCCGP